MDRLISEKQVIDTIKTWATPLQISNSETIEDLWVNGVCELIKAIPSADMFSDLKAEINMYENNEQSIDEMIQGIKSIISIYER